MPPKLVNLLKALSDVEDQICLSPKIIANENVVISSRGIKKG